MLNSEYTLQIVPCVLLPISSLLMSTMFLIKLLSGWLVISNPKETNLNRSYSCSAFYCDYDVKWR